VELKQLITTGGMVASTPAVGESIETIVVARLDWLWPQICGSRERIDGVKIDVQGMELEVLKGMKMLLKTYHPKLVVELHSGVDRTALLDLLETCGYSRRATPIYSVPGEEQEPQYYDNLSYAFAAR
jgi:Methyltransferase FkbM domain